METVMPIILVPFARFSSRSYGVNIAYDVLLCRLYKSLLQGVKRK